MTTPDRDGLRRLADAATPGPWEADDMSGAVWPTDGMGAVSYDSGQADAEFIAAARTAVPALLDALEQAEARIQAVRDLCDASVSDEDMDAISAHHNAGYEIALQDIRRALDA